MAFREMRPYFEMAVYLSAQIQVIECLGSFGSIHNVPEETVQKMKRRYISETSVRLILSDQFGVNADVYPFVYLYANHKS